MIKPADELGPVLTGRAVGTRLRAQIEQAAARGEVTVDMTGVEVMSPSFADELFAKLPREMLDSHRIRFENLDERLEPLVRFVISGRPARDASELP